MTNSANLVNITGRLTRNPVFFQNNDGSQKVKATIAVQDNFRSGADKTRKSQFIAVEQFLPVKLGTGAWANVTKGSQVQILGHLESNNYEKDGKMVYGGLILAVDSVSYLETKAETETRRNAQAAAAAPAPEAAEPAPEAAPAPKAKRTRSKKSKPAEAAPAPMEDKSEMPFGN